MDNTQKARPDPAQAKQVSMDAAEKLVALEAAGRALRDALVGCEEAVERDRLKSELTKVRQEILEASAVARNVPLPQTTGPYHKRQGRTGQGGEK
jgi:hypothetical protein